MTLSGRYQEVFSDSKEREAVEQEVELRVDVDGLRPLNVVSGDFFSTLDSSRSYSGSFRCKVKRQTNEDAIVLNGVDAEFTLGFKPFESITVSIPLSPKSQKASVQLTNSSGTTSNHTCERKSEFFRSILLHHNYEENVAPLTPYEAKQLTSQSKRTQPLSISSAFAEAGIEVIVEENKEPIPHPPVVQGEAVWTDLELYNAMHAHFTYAKEWPQWKLWLLSANEYIICTVKGIMLIHQGKTRQGCAVFQSATGWENSQEKRLRLFIYMHELGHCFNLKHPWNDPQVNPSENVGSSTLSWMNYPWRYRLSEEVYGSEEFWKAFNFEFSECELMHLRHGFRNDVIFGDKGDVLTKEIGGNANKEQDS